MTARLLAARIGEFLTLTATEAGALDDLVTGERMVRRHQPLVRENEPSAELFVVGSGVMMSYMLLDDGRRQILRFLFPGDLLGLTSLAYAASPVAVAAIADSRVHPIDRARFARFGMAHPRLLLALAALDQEDRTALTDRLAGIGRTSARARIAGLLLELRDRLRHGGATVDAGFALGITQEEMGDATGLTAVHVNRMLRQLDDEGLISRAAGRVILRDEDGLRRAANYVDRAGRAGLRWLDAQPPA